MRKIDFKNPRENKVQRGGNLKNEFHRTRSRIRILRSFVGNEVE